MKITIYNGNADFPDYRTVTSTANSSKHLSERTPAITIQYHLTSLRTRKTIFPLHVCWLMKRRRALKAG